MIAFILGVVISGTTVYAATILLASSEVSYDNSSSKLTSTNVQDALDELNTKVNSRIKPDYLDFTTLTTNTSKKILASKNAVCIKRNNKVSCFKINNWAEEQNHIQQVFSDISCSVDSSNVDCNASDFNCIVNSNGSVSCSDRSVNSACHVDSNGSVSCT